MTMHMADEDVVTSGTTFVDVTDLEIDVSENNPQSFEHELFISVSSALSGAKFQLASADALDAGQAQVSVDGASSLLSDVLGVPFTILTAGNHHVRIAGGLFAGDPAANLRVQFAQNAALGGNVTIKKCSWVRWWAVDP